MRIEGSFFMVKIIGMIDDFKLNQEILGREPKYVELCMYLLNRWKDFMIQTAHIEEVEEVKAIHIKHYIKNRQDAGVESNRTIKVLFSTL